MRTKRVQPARGGLNPIGTLSGCYTLVMSENGKISLNPKQKQAVEHEGGPLLIVAGPGTGKTRVITERIRYLISEKGIGPQNILALTFTEKAAGEMLARVDEVMPLGYEEPWLLTFHAFCDRILRLSGLEIGLDPDYKIMTAPEQWLFVREHLFDFDLKYFRPLGNPSKFISALLAFFSRLQDEDISVDEFGKFVKSRFVIRELSTVKCKGQDDFSCHSEPPRELEGVKNPSSRGSFVPMSIGTQDDDESVRESERGELAKLEELARAYETYQELKLVESKMDFGDLIAWALKLFRERPSVLAKYREKFQYILVDEFQDTNYAQYQLIKFLAPSDQGPNLLVVGDDFQCLPPGSLVETLGGKVKIEDLRVGDSVVSAVGKGYTSTARISRIFKDERRTRLLTFVTESGKEITVTDNHKMFCFVPPVPKGKNRYFVYLMEQQNIGWRMGVTNDLAARLRQEHRADRIIAVGSYSSQAEALYYETLYSLKYAIPTICFFERPDLVVKGPWLDRLYRELDTRKNVHKLAQDLNIDLGAHHFSVDGVTRGRTRRLKVNVQLCYRKYTTKWNIGGFLKNPKISHMVSVYTSDAVQIQRMKKAGFKLTRAKKGLRYRFASLDIHKIGTVVEKLQRVTGGIVDAKFAVGTANIQHRPARIMPAKNVLVGQYLPILVGRKIVYDQVVKRDEEWRECPVYDLEIERTHNFVANGVVVHNSIYKFRGAALSNILNYKKDYPEAGTVVLNQDYRNPQPVLDAVRRLVKQNEPNTLEARIGINKSLRSAKRGSANGRARQGKESDSLLCKESDSGELTSPKSLALGNSDPRESAEGVIEVLSCESVLEEAEQVVAKIIGLAKEGNYEWRDFAILARANAHLDPFVAALRRAGVPYQLLGNRGLFDQPEIRELIAFLRVVADTANGPALFELMASPVFGIKPELAADLLASARKIRMPLWQVVGGARTKPCSRLDGSGPEKEAPQGGAATGKGVPLLVREVENARADILKTPPTRLLYDFVTGSGFLEQFLKEESIENQLKIKNLNLFFEKIKKFEADAPNPTVPDFVSYLELLMEAGENPAQAEIEDIDTVNLLTVHSAKGLEWPVVFLVNLVAGRFPARRRGTVLEIPEELVKDILSEGDQHLQEERRLFYVGCTRASERLFLTWAKDYGGKKEWKMSGFIEELGMKGGEKGEKERREQVPLLLSLPEVGSDTKYQILNAKYRPAFVSYSQLETFKQCPLKYKYRYVLGIPTLPNHTLSFGQTLHRVLRDFHRADLFQKKELSYLLELYKRHWIEEGYDSEEHKKARFAEGKKLLEAYFEEHSKKLGRPIYLEKKFTLKVDGVPVIGSIDRVDEIGGVEGHPKPAGVAATHASPFAEAGHAPQLQHFRDFLPNSWPGGRRGVEIVDYKTGKVKDQRAVDKDEQLTIYALAARDALGLNPRNLSLYFIDGNVKVSTTRTAEQLAAAREGIKKTIEAIKKSDFKPTPNFLCDYCDFRQICPAYKI